MKHLPLLLQVSAVRVDGRWISGRRSPELRVPSCFPDSSTSLSFFSSSSFVSRLSAQPPLLHPWHAAGQLPDGPPQRPLHSHHCLHDDGEPERSVQDEPITPSLVRFIGTELSFLAHPLLPRHAALQWTGRKNKDKCHTKAHTKMHKRQTVTKKSEYITMTPWIYSPPREPHIHGAEWRRLRSYNSLESPCQTAATVQTTDPPPNYSLKKASQSGLGF